MNGWWTNALPHYNYAVTSLRDILKKEADDRGDGIDQPYRYFQCLPPTLTPEMEPAIIEKKLTEIRFQKDTNVDFFITVEGHWDEQRPLRIFCSSGFMEIHPFNGSIYRHISIPTLQIDFSSQAPFDQSHALIDEGLKILIGAQEKASKPKQ